MIELGLFVAAAAAVLAVGRWLERQAPALAAAASSSTPEPAPASPDPVSASTWSPPAAAEPYRAAIAAAERRQGVPPLLLARLLYQESRYRADIISGQTQSSAGAVGIAQIVPRWHPGVDPRDPFASIDYAALYLRQNFDRFGSWAKALAAYNAGPTRLAREAGSPSWLQRLPRETQNYVRAILGDVPAAEVV